MPGLFITATGTDIGKTFVTSGLIRAAQRAGCAVDAFKPILSGYDPSAAATSDAGVLLAALSRPITASTVAALSPWRFAAPLSPDMAATAEGRQIELAEVIAACRAAITDRCLTFVEGVGGAMVPLAETHTVLDLMTALDLPVVLIAGTYLGTISHCLTALAALQARGIAPKLLVLNESPGSTVSAEATARTLSRFYADARLAIVPRRPADRVFDDLLPRVLSASAPSRAP